MKTLKEIHVIVKQLDTYTDFFQDYVSFDKKKLEKKAIELNEKANEVLRKFAIKNKAPFVPLVFFLVMNLEEAVKAYTDDVIDSHSYRDASY